VTYKNSNSFCVFITFGFTLGKCHRLVINELFQCFGQKQFSTGLQGALSAYNLIGDGLKLSKKEIVLNQLSPCY